MQGLSAAYLQLVAVALLSLGNGYFPIPLTEIGQSVWLVLYLQTQDVWGSYFSSSQVSVCFLHGELLAKNFTTGGA